MTDFKFENCTLGGLYHAVPGKSRMAARRTESFRNDSGKISRVRRSPASNSFNPSSPFDGQSLAGSGALVFEGELLGR